MITIRIESCNKGWKESLFNNKYHFFINGQSLCRKYVTFNSNGYYKNIDDNPNNCKECKDKLIEISQKEEQKG